MVCILDSVMTTGDIPLGGRIRLQIILATFISCYFSFSILVFTSLSDSADEVMVFSVARAVIAAFSLTLFPGWIILLLFRVRLANIMRQLLLCVGIGIAYSYLVGAVLLLTSQSLFDGYTLSMPKVYAFVIMPQLACVIYLMLNLPKYAGKVAGQGSRRIHLSMNHILSLIGLCLCVGGSVSCAEAFNSTGNASFQMIAVLLPFGLVVYAFRKGDDVVSAAAIWALSLALVLHRALLSDYVVGFDVNHELMIVRQILSSGEWDTSIPLNTNAVVSITAFFPLATVMTGLTEVYVAKLVFPLLYSTVPVILFASFRRYLDVRMAMIACLFFTVQFVFFTELIGLLRQMMAELFLALVLMVLLKRSGDTLTDSSHSRILLVLCVGVIVSHYGVAVILGTLLAIGYVVSRTVELQSKEVSSRRRSGYASGRLLAIYWVFLFLWYSSFSSGSFLGEMTHIGEKLMMDMVSFVTGTYAPDPYVEAALTPITGESTLPRLLFGFLTYLVFLLSAIGFVYVLLKKETVRYSPFVYLSLGAFLLLASGFIVPVFSRTLNGSRLIHLSLLVVSFWIPVGFVCVSNVLVRLRKMLGLPVVKKGLQSRSPHNPAGSIAGRVAITVLFAFLVFNSGIAYQLAGDPPYSISFDKSRDYVTFSNSDVAGAEFLIQVLNGNDSSCCDLYSGILLIGYDIHLDALTYPRESTSIDSGLVFIRSANLAGTFMLADLDTGYPIPFVGEDGQAYLDSLLLDTDSIIYSNGGCDILWM